MPRVKLLVVNPRKFLEPAISIGCALFGLPPPVGAVAGGTVKLLNTALDGSKKHVFDSEKMIAAMRAAALRAADRYDVDEAMRDAIAEADGAMAAHLIHCVPSYEDVIACAKAGDLADTVSRLVVDRLATHNPLFAERTDTPGGFDARAFAVDLIKSMLHAALSDKDYAQSLSVYLGIETVSGLARVEDGMAEVLAYVRAQKAGSSLTDQALRGAIARFIAIRPDAAEGEVVEAVAQFERDYRALLEQVSHISVNDNHIQSLKVAAEEALAAGDIATARQRYREAAKAATDKASEPARNAAALKAAEASAALTMLDWQSADAAWVQAAAMVMPFDVAAGEDIVWDAAERLYQFGETFGQTPALIASEPRWRALETAAAARGNAKRAASAQMSLGVMLATQGERTDGESSLALLGQAVDAFRAALTVYTKEAMPADWATAQNNLGNALSVRGQRMGGEAGLVMLGEAVDAFRAALTIYTETAMPAEWAMVQNNLGVVLRVQGEWTQGEAGLALFGQTVAAYRAALTVYTQATMPAQWSGTQNNLGIVLARQGELTEGEAGLDLLGEAVAAFRASLTVRTEAAMPYHYGVTTKNLARAEAAIAALRG